MSVVVRMEMPKSCPCELAGGYDIPMPCFACHGVPKRCKEFDECVEKGTKPDWCPFICSIPEEHGRLVDADAMADDVRILWDYKTVDGITASTVLKQIITDIGNCPTIVPAERGEHV